MSRKLFVAAALSIATVAAPIAAVPAFAQAAAAKFNTTDTTIGDLLANAETKAVLEKHLKEFVSNPQIEQASSMTLKQIQSYAGDALSDAKLAAVDADLAKIK
jgi:hypothetical protein